jgi:hypothetical protein
VGHAVNQHQVLARPDRRGVHEKEDCAVNDIDVRVSKLETAVWKLNYELNEAKRVIDLLLVNDPECKVTKHFVERAKKSREHCDRLRKAQEKLKQLRSDAEEIMCEYPELRVNQ